MKSIKITTDVVKKVAKLANLPITSQQENKFADQLSNILGFISKIQSVDTTDVKPTSQVTGIENVMRDDDVDVTRMLSQEQALSNAKRKHNGFFVVPAVFEE